MMTVKKGKNRIIKAWKKLKYNSRKVFYFLPDAPYLKLYYQVTMKKRLDLKNPKSLNEKLQWLKLYDRRPEYSMMVDKYLAKEYIAKKVGPEFAVPLLGVWDHAEDIDFDSLPNQFVLKCNHNSGTGMYICKDKTKIDVSRVRRQLNKGLKQDYFKIGREWPYKKVPRKIIAEEYLVDESGVELKDYKIFCFNGRPEYVEVDFNRHIEHKLNPYSFDWELLNFCDSSPNDKTAVIKRPAQLDEMREIAAVLSQGLPFIRIDFYSVYDRIYVGELTLFPGSGCIRFNPSAVDLYYGAMLKLPQKTRIR